MLVVSTQYALPQMSNEGRAAIPGTSVLRGERDNECEILCASGKDARKSAKSDPRDDGVVPRGSYVSM